MRTEFSNRLLRNLSDKDQALLLPMLKRAPLAPQQILEDANQAIEHAYFPEGGIISIVAKSGDQRIEAGVIGREGMSGMAIVLGNHRSPNDARVQIAGEAHRINADDLRLALGMSATLRTRLQHFAQVFMTQIAQTALSNGRAKLEVRLARWLLMAHDRLDDEELNLTHDLIAMMLGVRRPGVTDAMNTLEGKGLVRSMRGSVRVLQRAGLETLAGHAYGVPEAEYRRLLGQ